MQPPTRFSHINQLCTRCHCQHIRLRSGATDTSTGIVDLRSGYTDHLIGVVCWQRPVLASITFTRLVLQSIWYPAVIRRRMQTMSEPEGDSQRYRGHAKVLMMTNTEAFPLHENHTGNQWLCSIFGEIPDCFLGWTFERGKRTPLPDHSSWSLLTVQIGIMHYSNCRSNSAIITLPGFSL